MASSFGTVGFWFFGEGASSLDLRRGSEFFLPQFPSPPPQTNPSQEEEGAAAAAALELRRKRRVG